MLAHELPRGWGNGRPRKVGRASTGPSRGAEKRDAIAYGVSAGIWTWSGSRSCHHPRALTTIRRLTRCQALLHRGSRFSGQDVVCLRDRSRVDVTWNAVRPPNAIDAAARPTAPFRSTKWRLASRVARRAARPDATQGGAEIWSREFLLYRVGDPSELIHGSTVE